MPTLKTFGAVKVCMFAEDHEPAHVHIHQAGNEVRLTIRDGVVLTTVGRLPARQLRAAMAWVAANRPDLLALWAAMTKR